MSICSPASLVLFTKYPNLRIFFLFFLAGGGVRGRGRGLEFVFFFSKNSNLEKKYFWEGAKVNVFFLQLFNKKKCRERGGGGAGKEWGGMGGGL